MRKKKCCWNESSWLSACYACEPLLQVLADYSAMYYCVYYVCVFIMSLLSVRIVLLRHEPFNKTPEDVP